MLRSSPWRGSALVPVRMFFTLMSGLVLGTNRSRAWEVLRGALTTGDSHCTGCSTSPRYECALGLIASSIKSLIEVELSTFPGLGQEGLADGTASHESLRQKRRLWCLSFTENECGRETPFLNPKMQGIVLGVRGWVDREGSVPQRGKELL